MTTEEKKVQSKLLLLLNKSKVVWSLKSITSNKSGVPDVIACINGYFVTFECKGKKGVVSPLQKLNNKQIWKSKGFAFVVRPSNFADIESIINDMIKGDRIVKGAYYEHSNQE